MGQVKAMWSNPRQERSAGAGGIGGGRPPPIMHRAAGDTPDHGDSDRWGSDDERGGRRDKEPNKWNKKPAEKAKSRRKNTERLWRTKNGSPRHWGKPLEKGPKVQLNLHQNMNMPNTMISGFGWPPVKIISTKKPYQWQNEAGRNKYALSKIKGSQVASFAMTYQNQMTG